MKYLFSFIFIMIVSCFYTRGYSAFLQADGESPVIELEENYVICDNQSLVLDAGNEGSGATYKWENISTNKVLSSARQFEISQSGNYRLTVIIESESASQDFVVIESFTPTTVIETKTYTLCVGSVITLDAGNAGADFLWVNDNSGDTISESQTATIAFKGKYSVAVITPCGRSVSGFLVDEIEYPDLKVVPAIGYLCAGDSVTIDAKNFDSRAAWMDLTSGDTLATTKRMTFGKLGEYELILYNQCDTVSQIVTIAPREFPELELGDERFICGNESLELDAGNAGANYEWVNVETKAVISNSQKIVVDKSGLFSVKVIDACGVISDTVKVSKTKAPEISLNSQYLICDGIADQINLNLFDVDFEWSRDGEVLSQESTFVPDEAGQYSLAVSNGCGTANHDFSVVESFLPKITIPSEFNVIALDGSVVLDAENEGASYKWIEVNSGKIIAETQTIEVTRSGDYILGVTTPCGGEEKVITVSLITGLPEENSREAYTISPNPAFASLSVKTNTKTRDRIIVTLHDITGNNAAEFSIQPGGRGNEAYNIDVSNLPRGVYIINISGEPAYRRKLILQ